MKADYASDRQAAWGYGNAVLYRMCQEEPYHAEQDVTAGKLWLIGRSYAASPERGSGKAKTDQDPDFFRHLAASEAWVELDSRLSFFTDRNPFSEHVLEALLETHRLLVRIIQEQSRSRMRFGKTPRVHTSFASKYLHFHRPDHFPIFDSYVSEALARLYPRFRSSRPSGSVDARYSRFCNLCLRYMIDFRFDSTLRQLDRVLYELQRERKRHLLQSSSQSLAGGY